MIDKKYPLESINFAAIPLSDRANRRLLRDVLAQYAEELEEARIAFDPELSMDDYMLKVKATQVVELRALDAIDALPDEEYVEAMIAFKKAVVLAYHAQAVKEGKYDGTVYSFCLQHFHEEYSIVGRAAAEDELMSISRPDVPPPPSVFVVAFDGTVVENQYPAIGGLSPYAISTMKALQKNGHQILIWHDRDDLYYRDMMTFLKMGEFVPNGTIKLLPVGDIPLKDITIEMGLEVPPKEEGIPGDTVKVEYLIHNSSYQCSRIGVTGDEENVSFYWGDLVQVLIDDLYLAAEDQEEIQAALAEAAAE